MLESQRNDPAEKPDALEPGGSANETPCPYQVPTNHPQWFYCRHTAVHTPNHLVPLPICETCVARHTPCETPRPESRMPSVARMGWNAAASAVAFLADGLRTVSADVYRQRLEICDQCEYRAHDRCTKCGCNLSLKARGRKFECPDGRWAGVDGDEQGEASS